jgi:ABC-type antimicrobial peptide transport system permease subunit
VKARDVLRLALEQLTRNLRRSAIAMLGLMVGVAALVALDSLGNATSFYLMTFIERMGQARIVRVRALGTTGLGTGARTFTPADLERVRRELPAVAAVSARVTDWQALATHAQAEMDAQVVGVDEHYLRMFSLAVQEGRGFTAEDGARRAAIAILGSEVRQRLFGGHDPLGRVVVAEGVPVRVVGVLQPSIFDEANQSVVVPLNTALARFRDCRKLDGFVVEASEPAAVESLAASLTRFLAATDRHGKQQYEVRVNRTALAQIRDSIRVLRAFVLAVSLVTLLLGGVGIMNVFLASLAERTREIGIRKAVGAAEEEIAAQVLTEAALICLLASCLGVALGIAVVQMVVLVTGRSELGALSAPNILAIVGFASLVGSLFALSPALRAARKDVVEAIRAN